MNNLKRSLSIAASILIFPLSSLAQNEPIVFEAESAASISSLYTSGTQNGATYVGIIADSPNFGPPATQEGALTYTVTFPAAGNYELYMRLLVGPGGGNDDSFHIGNGFGDRVATAGPWTLVNNFAGGYTEPDETVRNAGFAGNQVFKWFKVTGFAGPSPWVVPAGQLTQTFQFAGRENGLLVDKFAFGYQGFWYTVGNLDTASAPTGTPPLPPPPPYEHSGPPMATGKDKFVGSAWSPGEASLQFDRYFNKVTPENAGKWGSVEGQRDVMNWTQADAAYDLAKANGWPFHWHVLVWGNQQPGWLENPSLTPEEKLEEIKEWFAAIAARYPDIDIVEVVNEPLHDPPTPGNGNYIDALGGTGVTGWDWIINAFRLAREYFPSSKLMLNDYSITNSTADTTRYIQIIDLLKAENLIDIIGDQGHGFSTTEAAPMPTHRANLDRLAATGLPIHITELDIPGNDDAVQLANYQRIFPVFWEHPGVAGITLWGYHQNTHWRRSSGDWLMYANGAQRPALTWLVSYVSNNLPEVAASTFSVEENAADGTVVGTAVATDEDSDQTLSAWQVDGGSGVAVFAIDADTGAISVVDGAALDFETTTSYTLNVSVFDGFRRSESATVTIDVENLNDNTPKIPAGQKLAVDGGTRNFLGVAAATDADDTNEPGFTDFQGWKIVGGTGANLFAIDANNGVVRASRPLLMDWRKSSYTLTLQTSDGANVSGTQSVTITIPNRVKTCLYGLDLTVPKKTTPVFILLGATLGSCRAH